MKTKLMLALMCFVFGCSTTHYQDMATLRAVKSDVLKLHRGMTRKEVEATLHPLPNPDPDLEINISGIVTVQYMLRRDIWVDADYASDGTLIFEPQELLVPTWNRLSQKLKPIALSKIQ